LEKLGVRRYVLDSGENNKGRTHRWSFLQPHPQDPCVTGLGLYIHWDVGVNGDRFLCPRFMKKEFQRLQAAWADTVFSVPEDIKHGKCPICEQRDRAVAKYKGMREDMGDKDRREWHTKHIYALQPFAGSFTDPQPNRRLVWIVDEHDDSTLDLGAQLAEIPVGGKTMPGVYKGLMDQAVDRETGAVLDVLDDGEEGFVFSFWREGSGKQGTSYTSHKLTPRKGALDEAWLDAVPRFVDVLRFATYEEIKEAFDGAPEAGESADAADPKVDVEKELREEVDRAVDQPRTRHRAASHEAPEDKPQDDPPPRRRRRSAPEPDEPGAEAKVPPEGVSPEALAAAERIRNRRRHRDEASGGDTK